MSVQVKICGITSESDGRAALDAGADFIGFVFYARSPRYITPDRAAQIISALNASDRAIGVFVNSLHDELLDIASACGLCALQLHGDESPDILEGLHVPAWRAVKRQDSAWIPDPSQWEAERFLADASVPNEYGGTGVPADWQATKELARSCPVMLAGGLDPGNVVEAIRTVSPLGVDVSSGVETQPGVKDHAKIREFIEKARSA